MSDPVARYADLRDELVSEIDEEFAETVGLRFLKGGLSDPDRTNINVIAVLRTGETRTTNLSGGESQKWKSEVAGEGATLSITHYQQWPIDIRKDDKVIALARPGRPAFIVTHVDLRSHTRTIVHLADHGFAKDQTP